jgi:hypothetical protein
MNRFVPEIYGYGWAAEDGHLDSENVTVSWYDVAALGLQSGFGMIGVQRQAWQVSASIIPTISDRAM